MCTFLLISRLIHYDDNIVPLLLLSLCIFARLFLLLFITGLIARSEKKYRL
jgi:hypothetical protein